MPFFIIIGLIFLSLLLAWALKEFIFVFVESVKFNTFLIRNYKEIWRQITSIGPIGPGLSNPFATYKWLRSNFESADAKLMSLKSGLKKRYDSFLISFVAFAVYLTLFCLIGDALFAVSGK